MAEYTIRDYAAREQVTPRTVRNWIAKGAVQSRKTPGGSWRILEDFDLHQSVRDPVRPLRFINAPDVETRGNSRKL